MKYLVLNCGKMEVCRFTKKQLCPGNLIRGRIQIHKEFDNFWTAFALKLKIEQGLAPAKARFSDGFNSLWESKT